jgi:GT2 family glycosyltransferase
LNGQPTHNQPPATASVICCTYRRDQVLCNTIRGLIAQQDGSFEILVIDQRAGHDETTTAFLRQTANAGQIRYFDLPAPGLTAARNFGAREAHSEFLIYCDDDVMLGPGWVAAHIASYRDPAVAAVAGQVLHENEIPREAPGTFAHNSPIHQFTQLYGANFSIRRKVYFQVGGSDENLGIHAYTEDLCLAKRLTTDGHQILYNPEATVLHLQTSRGGCRISDLTQTTREWEKPFSKLYWLFLSPPSGSRTLMTRVWEALRHGPLRRTAVVRPWRQPAAWLGFFQAIRKARQAASQIGPVASAAVVSHRNGKL